MLQGAGWPRRCIIHVFTCMSTVSGVPRALPKGPPPLVKKMGGETTQNLEDVPGTLENG